jgi:hypothetical protein
MTKTEVQKVTQMPSKEVVALPVQADPLLTLIERVACDPSADVGKMRALLEMHQSLQDRQAEKMYGVAMAAAQMEMEPIRADASNPQTKSRYASFPALDKVLRPIYTKHGFALSFNTVPCDQPDKVNLVCDVFHRDGHMRRHTLPMPADGKGAKGGEVMTKTHATGSALSYGQRYLTKMIFNISVARDDDGNKAAALPSGITTNGGETGELISAEQLAQLQALAVEVGANVPAFCKWTNIESLDAILASQFDKAFAAMAAKRKKS